MQPPPPCPRNFAEHLLSGAGKGMGGGGITEPEGEGEGAEKGYRNFRFQSKLGLRATTVCSVAKQLEVGTVRAAWHKKTAEKWAPPLPPDPTTRRKNRFKLAARVPKAALFFFVF